MKKNYVKVDFNAIENETDDAYLIVFSEGDDPLWVPSSIIDEIDEDAGTVTLEKWFAEQEELIEEDL
jgi:hypothetical protein